MKKEPLVSIIIVTYNNYDLTQPCIDSLMDCGYNNMKIYIVDNGSEEKIYKEFYNKNQDNPAIEFIALSKNVGFGGGCNAALEKIEKGYIVFLSNDTVVTKHWLQPLISYMEENKNVGATQPKVKDIKRKNYFEYAGASGGFMDIYGYPFSRGRIFFTLEKDTGQYDDIVDVVWCSGVALITKKEVIEKTGFMDDIFFLYAEEADLCWRMHHAGYRLVFIPNSTVYHYGSKKSIIDKTFFSHRNGLIMLLKNYSTVQLLTYLPIRILLDIIAFFYYIITLYPSHSIDMIKAYISLSTLIPQVLKKRKEVDRVKKANRNNKVVYPLYKRSIIVDYFLKGKKTFTVLDKQDFTRFSLS